MAGVHAFVGKWGSGKTLAMVEECMKYQGWGHRIASNFGYLGGENVDTLGEVLALLRRPVERDERGAPTSPLYLALDEAGALFPAREYSKWPPALNVLVQQGRKFGITLGYTTQCLEFVDTNLRRVTGHVTECRGFGHVRVSEPGAMPEENRARLFLRTTFSGENYGKARAKSESFAIRRFKPEVGERYDTYYVVQAMQRVLAEQSAITEGST